MVENKGAFCIAIRVQKMLEAAGYEICSIGIQPHHRIDAALNINIIFSNQQEHIHDINIIFCNQGDVSTQLQNIYIIDNLQMKVDIARTEITSEQINSIFTHIIQSSQFNQTVAQLIINKIQSIASET